jgi:hypothetical protein
MPNVSDARTSDQKLFGRQAYATLVNMRTSQRLDVSGLRMKFKIEKSVGSDPNQSEIEIFNLSEASRTFANIPVIEKSDKELKAPVLKNEAGKADKSKIPKDGLFVELYAGYEGLTRIICTGNAAGGSMYQSPDWVTKLLVSDGHLHLRNVTFSKTYTAGYSMNRVILDLVESFGLPLGYVMPFITSDVVEFGLTLSGQNKKLLDGFAATYGFKWSVQNNAINLFNEKQALPEVVKLTPRTGLLSSPIRTDKGLEFDCLLIPLISPGVTVQIGGSSTFEGDCLVQRVQMTGDTHGPEWKMHVEAKLK